ncbi:hypothetical protein HELRODRAFT_116835 [Helobdella robusta]|uniref:CLIC N-terminal domain-containing protein n=1 Tax=Helobdella robusta TaxID=6412 RepID=T1EGI2_HELRO|nr:hypothetical protein HELRODRAFT_116835 [Helobdella robusta]ESO11341.1 hypothetical protein HELRODRAFT_116835 [Helobdella robusta]
MHPSTSTANHNNITQKSPQQHQPQPQQHQPQHQPQLQQQQQQQQQFTQSASNNIAINNHLTNANNNKQVELFVKAGKDGESYGGCPICQRFFMILLTKADYNKDLSLIVTTVNMSKPPPDFKKLATRLPVLNHQDQIISDQDEMVQYIDKTFRYPPMNYDNVAAAKACRDVFSKFSFYIKDVSQSPAALLAELHRLNDYLMNSPHKFLCRDVPDHLDCMMLPKLQHLRVAAKAFKNFDIPLEFKGLWRYLATAYNTTSFRESCPSDQEIIFHWGSKPECPDLSKDFQLSEATPKYSFDYPADAYKE